MHALAILLSVIKSFFSDDFWFFGVMVVVALHRRSDPVGLGRLACDPRTPCTVHPSTRSPKRSWWLMSLTYSIGNVRLAGSSKDEISCGKRILEATKS